MFVFFVSLKHFGTSTVLPLVKRFYYNRLLTKSTRYRQRNICLKKRNFLICFFFFKSSPIDCKCECHCETSVGYKWDTDAILWFMTTDALSIWWRLGFLPTSCIALALAAVRCSVLLAWGFSDHSRGQEKDTEPSHPLLRVHIGSSLPPNRVNVKELVLNNMQH